MELPIFPLNTVLFPGAQLPLHIFEPRYQQMINRCIETQSPFGVCLIQKGSEVAGPAEPFATGTTAHIASVQRLDEGRMNITCTGGNRFTIREITHHDPYLIADVDVLVIAPDASDHAGDITQAAADFYAEYVRLNLAVTNQWSRSIDTPAHAAALSDYIAARIAIDLSARQRLLEEPSPKLRLHKEVELLAGLIRDLTLRIRIARANRWFGFAMLN